MEGVGETGFDVSELSPLRPWEAEMGCTCDATLRICLGDLDSTLATSALVDQPYLRVASKDKYEIRRKDQASESGAGEIEIGHVRPRETLRSSRIMSANIFPLNVLSYWLLNLRSPNIRNI